MRKQSKKFLSLCLALVMALGTLTFPAYACTADKDGNITPCEKVEEQGYCDIEWLRGIDWEAGVMYQWLNPYYKEVKNPAPTGGTTGNISGEGERVGHSTPGNGLMPADEFFEMQIREGYHDIVDYDNWTIYYVDENGQTTGYKVIDPEYNDVSFFYPDGTPVDMKDRGKLDFTAENPFAALDQPKPVKKFDDVSENAWYYNAVSSMAANGILNGYPDGLFHPDDNVTIGEMAVIIYQLASGENPVGKTGEPEGVYSNQTGWWNSTHWAAYAINTLYTREVKYLYRPVDNADDYVTRAEAIHAVYLLARETGNLDENNIVEKYNFDLDDKTVWPFINLHTYTDAELQEKSGIPDLAINPDLGYSISTSLLFNVMRAYKYGLVHGVDSEGNCHPNDSLTRAELCQMLYNAGITGYTGPTNFKAGKGWDKRVITNQ